MIFAIQAVLGFLYIGTFSFHPEKHMFVNWANWLPKKNQDLKTCWKQNICVGMTEGVCRLWSQHMA